MAADPNWGRWIFASVAYHLKQVADDNQLPFLIEHLSDRTEQFMRATDRAELKITGPFAQEISKDYHRIRVDVNVLFTSRYDGDKDGYRILKLAGQFQEAMSAPIPLWNYGNEPGDFDPDVPSTQVHLGCLLPRSGRDDAVRLFNFGQIERVDKLKQTMLDGRYEVYFST